MLAEQPIGRKIAEYGISREFVEKYGLELAEYYCQPKIDVKVLAEKYGSKLRKHYPFPELENSHVNRVTCAQAIEDEGGVYVRQNNEENKGGLYSYLKPEITYTNTSKGLAERVTSWMGTKLPNPRSHDAKYMPLYYVGRGGAPAIYLVYLIRPFLLKRKNVESADKIIEMFKERASVRCDENGNPIPLPEPKYLVAHKLRREGLSCKEIAQRLGCSLNNTYSFIRRGKNPELYLKYYRERYLKRKMSTR